MFDDPKKELQQLQDKLLHDQEDTWLDEALEDAHRLLGDDLPGDPEDLTRDIPSPRPARRPGNVVYDEEPEEQPFDRKGGRAISALFLLLCLELLGIAAIVVYWLLFLM